MLTACAKAVTEFDVAREQSFFRLKRIPCLFHENKNKYTLNGHVWAAKEPKLNNLQINCKVKLYLFVSNLLAKSICGSSECANDSLGIQIGSILKVGL